MPREYFDGTAVDCTVEVIDIHEREVSGEKRRNIFLSFKESLNNILKHAHATTVGISIYTEDHKLFIKNATTEWARPEKSAQVWERP